MASPKRYLPRKPSQAQLDETDLSGADLTGCVLYGLSLRGRDLSGARLVDASLVSADLQRADLSGADLSDAELDRADLQGADLSGATLVRTRAEDTDFSSAELQRVDLTGAILSRARLVRASLVDAKLSEGRLEGAALTGATLRGARLNGAALDDADLTGADLREAELAGATLERASLDDADLRGASLLRARLDGACLRGAKLEGADLRRAVISRADVTGLEVERLRAAGLTARDLEGADDALMALLEREGARVGPGLWSRLLALFAGRGDRPAPDAPALDLATEAAEPAAEGAASTSAPEPQTAGAPAPGLAPPPRDEPPPAPEPTAPPAISSLEPPEQTSTGPAAPLTPPSTDIAAPPAVWSEPSSALDVPTPGALETPDPREEAPAPASAQMAPEVPRAPLPLEEEPKTDPALALEEEPRTDGPREERTEACPSSPEVRALTAAAAAEVADAAAATSEADGADGAGAAELEATDDAGATDDAEGPAEPTGLGARLSALLPRGEALPDSLSPGADLSGRDMRRAKLAGRDLSGADLRGARLQGADLARCVLRGAKLDRARLDRARLLGADLVGASAEGARFDDAQLASADLRHLKAQRASFIGANFSGAQLEGADLQAADLSAAQLADVDLADADLSGALLEQADLAGARLDGCAVEGAEFDGALGLSADELDALRERGAQVSVFSFARLSTNLGASRIARVAALGLAFGIGGYLLYQFQHTNSQSDEELEGVASVLAEAGEIDEALARYESLLERSELAADRVIYRFEMATLLGEARRWDEAREALVAAVAEAGDEPDLRAEAQLRLADALAESNELDEAVRAYEVLATEDADPDVLARALVGLSDAYAAMGFPDKALALQQDVLERFPYNPGVLLAVRSSMAEILSARGEYDAALEALEQIEGYPLEDDQRARLMADQARLYDDMGDAERSLETYKSLLQRYPGHAGVDGEILLNIASLSARQGDIKTAREVLASLESRAVAPDTAARVLLLQAGLAERAGESAGAIAIYRRVLDEHPAARDAVETARIALARLSPQDEALSGSTDPTLKAQILLGRAQALHERGAFDEARVLYEEVSRDYADVGGAVETAQTQLASLLLAEGQYGEAVNAYRALLEQTEDADARAFLEAALGDAYLQAGQLSEAERAFETLQLGREADEEAAVLGSLGLARVAEARGDIERARRLYRAVIDGAADATLQGVALESLAGSFLESGQDEDAMQAYRRFLQKLPEGHEAAFDAQLAMAGIYRRRGESARALELYADLAGRADTPSRAAQAQAAQADLLESTGASAEAQAIYRALLRGGGVEGAFRDDVVVGLARTTLELGDAEDALKIARSQGENVSSPAAEVALIQVRARALRALGKTEEADALAQRLLSAAGDDGDAAFNAKLELASAAINQAEYEQAIRLYQELQAQVQDRPSIAAMALSIAQTRAAAGDLEGARADYERVLSTNADLQEVAFNAGMGLAHVERMEGTPEAAAERYRGLRAPDPGSEGWRLEQLAQTLTELGDDDGAEAIFRQILDEMSEPGARASGQMGLAHLLRSRDELDEARSLYQEVAEDAPDSTQREWAQLNAAQVLVDKQELGDAYSELQALRQSASDPEVQLQARLGIAAIMLETGRAEDAVDLLSELDASALGPAWVSALVQQRVACLVHVGDLDAAVTELEAALAAYPGDDDVASQAQIGLGDLAQQRGEPREALSRYDAVLDRSEDRFYQAQALLGRARALRASGEESDARATYERVASEYDDQSELAAVAEQVLAGGI